MSLIRYFNPFKELSRIQRDFHSHFNTATYLAPLDLIENDAEFVIQVNLPGFVKEEINVEVDFEHVTITAEHVEAEQVEETTEEDEKSETVGPKYLLQERYAQKLSRTVNFRKPINPSKASTKLNNGVLTVTIGKSEEAKSVKLSIN